MNFDEYLTERKNPIPVGRFDSDDRMNVDGLVNTVERSRPRIISISPRILVDAGLLFATQHEIDNRQGFDDPVFDDYADKPVLVNHSDDNTYILDGHHRMARAFDRNERISVYIFDT